MHSEKNSVVAILETHNPAEDAIRELPRNGVDMKELSIVAKDCHLVSSGGDTSSPGNR